MARIGEMRAGQLRRGSLLGKYRLEKRLGQGASATVWKARDTVENRYVALKIVDPQFEEEFGREEIEREARIASRLVHPNIVTVRNADWIGGRFVLATDLAERSLAAYPGARRSVAIGLRVLRDVAAGLAHAHEQRVLHLDIKPENVLIFPDRRAAIADFGISRFARSGTQTYIEAGTLGYMAPEQAYGRARLGSDVFSLGLIAFEFVGGRVLSWPFSWPADEFHRLAERIPEPLRPVLRRAVAFRPGQRYPDAIAFRDAVEAALSRIESSRNGTKPRPRRRPRETPSPLALAGQLFRRRHGAALGLRYQCHHCEGPLAEAMGFCPWCGSADNSFREITRAPLACPECERGVEPEWEVCPWCYAGRFEARGLPPRRDPAAVRSCSRRGCAGTLRAFMRYCPACKQKVRRPWSHPGLTDRCERCRWPVSHEFWSHCPWCGRREPRAGSFVQRRG